MKDVRDKLAAILATMDVPPARRTDEALTEMQHLRWLSRNMFIRNSQHPQHQEAEALLRQLLKAGSTAS